MAKSLAVLESALRVQKLDRTLTSALPPLERTDSGACLTTGLTALDVSLRGGLPRGQLSELAGSPASSGRTTLLLHIIAAATRRGEIAALVDTFDGFDVASAIAAGVDLDRLLWIRGHVVTQQLPLQQATPLDVARGVLSESRRTETRRHREQFQSGTDSLRHRERLSRNSEALCLCASVARSQSELVERAVDRGLKALNLVLQAGGFAVVALDLADVPIAALKRLPFTTWLRVQRTIEGSDTACLLMVPQPLARSAGGLTLLLAGRARWAGTSDRSRHLAGIDMTVQVISPRRRGEQEIHVGAQVLGCSGA